MSILISAMSQTPRSFDDAANAAIDAASFFLSEGNWREHISELFLSQREDTLPVEEIDKAAEAFISYHAGKIGLSDYTRWHIAQAEKIRALATVARSHGAEMIGVAG